jgi:hypothetical protein
LRPLHISFDWLGFQGVESRIGGWFICCFILTMRFVDLEKVDGSLFSPSTALRCLAVVLCCWAQRLTCEQLLVYFPYIFVCLSHHVNPATTYGHGLC